MRQLGDKMSKFKADAEMYVICASGSRSGSAVGALPPRRLRERVQRQGGVSRWRGKLVRVVPTAGGLGMKRLAVRLLPGCALLGGVVGFGVLVCP
jgi:hypothetical protein